MPKKDESFRSYSVNQVADMICAEFPAGPAHELLRGRIQRYGYSGAKLAAELQETPDLVETEFHRQVIRSITDEHGNKIWGLVTTGARSPEQKLHTLFTKLNFDMAQISFPGASSKMLQLVGAVERGGGSFFFKTLEELQLKRSRPHDCLFPDGDNAFWVITKGGEPYVSPQGWLRTSFKPKVAGISEQELFDNWAVAYHGTNGKNIYSITSIGLAKPGTAGVEVCHGNAGATKGKAPIYVSPSVEYAAHWFYTTGGHKATFDEVECFLEDGDSAKGDHFVQFVFELRVDPRRIARRQGNTFDKTGWPEHLPFDRYHWFERDSGNLEWLVEDTSAVCITGLMIRLLPEDPRVYNQRRIEAMQMLTRCPAAPLRPREPGTKGRWQWNCADGVWAPLEDEGPFQNYDSHVSARIEYAYQNYLRIAFLGKLGSRDYYVDFDDMMQHRADSDREAAELKRRVRRIT